MSERFIDREEIKRILTQDSHYRKNKKWPLLTSENFYLINSHEDIHVIDMLNVKLKSKSDNIHFDINDFSKRIDEKYNFVNDILNKFEGHLIACGGCIVNTLIDIPETKHSDLDLFFYDLTVEKANEMRISVISEIINNWKSCFDHFDDQRFIIKRNEFVTSVYVFNDYGGLFVEYQLIHRIYPDISSIIGVRV